MILIVGEQTAPLDFTPLSASCPPGDVAAMRAAAGQAGGFGVPVALRRMFLRSGIVIVLGLAALFVLSGTPGRIAVLVIAALAVAFWLANLWFWSGIARRTALTRARLVRFAAANGFSYDPRRLPFPDAQDRELIYHRVGSEVTIRDRLTGFRGRAFETYGIDFMTTVGLRMSGRTRAAHYRGVTRFALAAELPGLWLDSSTRPMLSGFLGALERYPKTFELEGDFQSQFRLHHAADATAAEVLYVLQPDVMAVLHDFGRGIQLQIDGSTAYLIGRYALPSGGRLVAERLFALLDELAPKLDKLALQRRQSPTSAPDGR